MPQDDAVSGASGDELTPTPEAAPPISADFMSSVMARFAQQHEVQKATSEQIAALVAALTAPTYNNNPINTDLRLTLNATKSRCILTSDPVPEQRSNRSVTDLRDKLNANTSDLRVLRNSSKSTDLRRHLVKNLKIGGSL
ncbi:hypothetical protein F2Q68_00039096 [Brassica cretica]|uniref:Uncharacterized protein n=1 Tax=Brassica cretica TaxID=69181 RepID=A0A8S9MS31_BRACR|nr:hypothetical protein F2Q68_00039096 [Brassica cretica]